MAIVAVLKDDPILDVGQWLVDQRRHIEGGEAAWFEALAEFDRDQLWAADGQLSGADWLGWRCKMARSTAFEKLRIAHELRRRPRLAAAFAAGQISYSAVRAFTRLEDPSDEVDEALVRLAVEGTVLQLEQAVRFTSSTTNKTAPSTGRFVGMTAAAFASTAASTASARPRSCSATSN